MNLGLVHQEINDDRCIDEWRHAGCLADGSKMVHSYE